MSDNILDLEIEENFDSAKYDEGFAKRISLTIFSGGKKGPMLQLTLGGYPYRFIHLNESNARKLKNKINQYLRSLN